MHVFPLECRLVSDQTLVSRLSVDSHLDSTVYNADGDISIVQPGSL